MTWTYDSTAPGSSGKSWIRMRIGDTSSGDQLLQDEQISAILDGEGNKYLAGAICAEMVGAWFARKVDKTVGKLRIAMQQASEHYFTLADRLRSECGTRADGAYAGGISKDDMDTQEDDTDRVVPQFSMGQFAYHDPLASSTVD